MSLFSYMYYFTIFSHISLIIWFWFGIIILFISYFYIYKKISLIPENKIKNTKIKKRNLLLFIASFVLWIISFYLLFDDLLENKKELSLEITNKIELNYDNNLWKIWNKRKDLYLEYVLNWRTIDNQSNIYIMPNLNSSVLINLEFQKKSIIAWGWKIIWQKEVEISWTKFYILEYSINSKGTIIYISSFQFLTSDKNNFISLNVLWKNYEKNVKILYKFMSNIVIKN